MMVRIKNQHQHWFKTAEREQSELAIYWCALSDRSRRQAELTARLNLAVGYAHYRMAELEDQTADQSKLVLGATYKTRLDKAAEYLRKAEAAHPNHYLVLQFLGLVYAEPRRDAKYLSIAEQYIERAILANKADYYSHTLLADVLLRRVTNSGLDITNLDMLKRGLDETRIAIENREFSGSSHLLRAQILAMLLELERDESKRQELSVSLEQSIKQAARYLPHVFDEPDIDLTWMRIVAATRKLGEEAEALQMAQTPADILAQHKQQRFNESKDTLIEMIDKLIEVCNTLEDRWVARQRVYQIEK